MPEDRDARRRRLRERIRGRMGAALARPGELASIRKALGDVEELCVCLLAKAVVQGQLTAEQVRQEIGEPGLAARVLSCAATIAGWHDDPPPAGGVSSRTVSLARTLVLLGPGGTYLRGYTPGEDGGTPDEPR